jgi:hypothetical protein
MVVVLGGGYGDRSWTYTGRFIAWTMTGRTIEPPPNEQLMLQDFRRIRRELDSSALTAEPNDTGWSFSEEDLVGILPEAPRRTRFLGYFSRHGVELVLERFDVLDELRVRGYEHPLVELDLEHPMGETLRIYGDPERRDLLVELRVNRSSRVVPDFEMLVVEWLLLQNPRAHFGPYRQPLPGQQHPGLGMLKDILGWLVMVCELIGLDGIYYSPSSYHVAAQSRHMVRFLNPRDEARFRAFQKAFENISLADASLAFDEDRVRDAATDEAVRWAGDPMVLPVSQRLKQLVFSEGYEAEVAEASDAFAFRVVEPELRGFES